MTITIESGITVGQGVAIGQLPVISGGGTTHTVTPNGNAQVSTSQAKFGTGSYTSNSTTGYLTVTPFSDFAWGTGNFTMEFWYYATSLTANSTVMGLRPKGLDGAYPAFVVQTNGTVGYYVGAAFRITTPINTVPINQWMSVAVVRNSGSTKMYINGVQSGSTYTDNTNYQAGSCWIGANDFQQTGSFPIRGFLDEVRFSNVARYTSNYTPATEPFFPDTNTRLLLHCDGTNGSTTFTDSSNII